MQHLSNLGHLDCETKLNVALVFRSAQQLPVNVSKLREAVLNPLRWQTQDPFGLKATKCGATSVSLVTRKPWCWPGALTMFSPPVSKRTALLYAGRKTDDKPVSLK
jgi:hypothetical protein